MQRIVSPRADGRRRLTGFTFPQLLIVIALIALLIAFLLPVVARTREQAGLMRCRDNLRRIGGGLIQYAQNNNGLLPVSASVDGPHVRLLQSLAACRCVGDPRNYYCPGGSQPRFRYGAENFKSGIIGYYYYSALDSGGNPALSTFLRSGVSWPRKLDTTMDPKTWVMSDIWISAAPTAHAGYRKGVNYLMLDGSVDFVGASPRQAFR